MCDDIKTQSDTNDTKIFTDIKADLLADYNIIYDDIIHAEIDVVTLIRNETDNIIDEINDIDADFKTGIYNSNISSGIGS